MADAMIVLVSTASIGVILLNIYAIVEGLSPTEPPSDSSASGSLSDEMTI